MPITPARVRATTGSPLGALWAAGALVLVLVACSDGSGDTDLGPPDAGNDADADPDCTYTPGNAGKALGATCADNVLEACTGGGAPYPIDCEELFAGQLEAACVESGDYAGCGVADGESCFISFDLSDPVVLFCDGTDAACVFQLDGPPPFCAQDIGSCDELTDPDDPYCLDDYLFFDCNGAQPVVIDCPGSGEGVTCRAATDDDPAHCAGTGPGGSCDADWDGTSDAGTALTRCFPGLECVGENRRRRGRCEDRCEEGTHCLAGWVVFDQILDESLAALEGHTVVFRSAYDWEGIDPSACGFDDPRVIVDGTALSVVLETSDPDAQRLLDRLAGPPTIDGMVFDGEAPDAEWSYLVGMRRSWLAVDAALRDWPFVGDCPVVDPELTLFSDETVVALGGASGQGAIWFGPRSDD